MTAAVRSASAAAAGNVAAQRKRARTRKRRGRGNDGGECMLKLSLLMPVRKDGEEMEGAGGGDNQYRRRTGKATTVGGPWEQR
eukprot:evm.model.NODE_9051_length_1318_cov_9.580425.1